MGLLAFYDVGQVIYSRTLGLFLSTLEMEVSPPRVSAMIQGHGFQHSAGPVEGAPFAPLCSYYFSVFQETKTVTTPPVLHLCRSSVSKSFL